MLLVSLRMRKCTLTANLSEEDVSESRLSLGMSLEEKNWSNSELVLVCGARRHMADAGLDSNLVCNSNSDVSVLRVGRREFLRNDINFPLRLSEPPADVSLQTK